MDHKKLKVWQYLQENDSYNERIYKIYALIDPGDMTIFYIGCTISPLHIRMSQHIYDISNGGKTKMIKKILNENSFPVIRILYKIQDKTKARIAEKYITHFLMHNKLKVDLKNMHGSNNISEKINLAR